MWQPFWQAYRIGAVVYSFPFRLSSEEDAEETELATMDMEMERDDEFHVIEWQISNFSSCAVEKLESPLSRAGNLYDTWWSISLYPKGRDDSDFLSCFLKREDNEKCGPLVMHVGFEFSLITFDGLSVHRKGSNEEFKRNDSFGFPEFVRLESVFSKEKFLLASDVLTIRCKFRCLGPKRKLVSKNVFKTKFPVEKVFAHLTLDNFLDTSRQNPRVFDLKGADKVLLSLEVSMNKEEVGEGAVESEKTESFLHIVIKEKDVKNPLYVSCWIKLLDNKTDIAVEKKLRHVFRKNEEWILPYFIDTRNLPSGCVEDGSLLLEIDFDICEQQHQSMMTGDLTPLKRRVDPKETTLMENLGHLHTTGMFSDFTIRAEDEAFSVHKSILAARSPVFEKIFESSTSLEEIADVDKNTMARLLKFIYTDSIPMEDMDDANRLSLYSAAQKYQISSLQARCLKFLKNNLSFKSIFKVLIHTQACDDSELKMFALDYIRQHYQFVLLTPEWQAFSEEHEELANQVMRYLRLKNQQH